MGNGWGAFDDERSSKRTLGTRDKQLLLRRADHKCENPKCGKDLRFEDMQVGHKTAWSRGGSTTFKNSVALCYTCNKLQGTDSWAQFLKKQGIQSAAGTVKNNLESLSLSQLKLLAKKHHVVVKGKVTENLFESSVSAPTKKQYVKKLSGVVTEEEINALPKKEAAPKSKPKKPRRRDELFGAFRSSGW